MGGATRTLTVESHGHSRRNSLDTGRLSVRPGTPLAQDMDQPRQLQQILRPKRRTPRSHHHERVLRCQVGPLHRQRHQLTVTIEDVHPIGCPVPAPLDELELATEQRMKPVRHPHPDQTLSYTINQCTRHWDRTTAANTPFGASNSSSKSKAAGALWRPCNDTAGSAPTSPPPPTTASPPSTPSATPSTETAGCHPPQHDQLTATPDWLPY